MFVNVSSEEEYHKRVLIEILVDSNRFFLANMTHVRFAEILRFSHFVDNNQPEKNRGKFETCLKI